MKKLIGKNSILAGSGSRYVCTLFEAISQTPIENLGNFEISLTYSETKQISDYIRINPDNLSQPAIDNISKGIITSRGH